MVAHWVGQLGTVCQLAGRLYVDVGGMYSHAARSVQLDGEERVLELGLAAALASDSHARGGGGRPELGVRHPDAWVVPLAQQSLTGVA